MAYAAVVSLARNLENFFQQDQSQIFDGNRKKHVFESLFGNVIILQDFLEKFPARARELDAQISDSANEAECLIGYYVSDMISSYGQVSDNIIDKFLLEINKVAATIESVVLEVKEISRIAIAVDDSTYDYLPRNSVSGKDVVVGLEDDMSKIKDGLFSDASELVTISVVGMGGIGKTTLVRAVFDDPAVISRFDRRRWVTVSHSYNIRETYLALLGENSSDDTTSIVDLTVKVHQLLKKRRYLIVFDDVWSSNAWDDMIRALPDDCNRSRVLLTTRDENVANYVVSSSAIHHLQLMDEKKSWSLFQKKVFGEEHCPPELVNIGKWIAEGCGGLPLAIAVISGILSNITHTIDSWNVIAENMNEALSNGDEHFIERLSLSYYHLPIHLKACFLYFGAFPEDYTISVSKLVKYWVGEGFLKAGKTTNDAEEIAYGCLHDLVKRNLIMVIRKKDTGEFRYCQIHDLLREICIRRAREEKFLHHVRDIKLSNARRASFTSEISSEIINANLSFVRTVLCFKHDDNLVLNLPSFRLLRVMDARSIVFEEFPSQLLQLYHLRYLALSYNDNGQFEIPAEVCKLCNLETLSVRPKYSSDGSVVAPPEIWRMRKLRHLKLRNLVSLPCRMGQTFHLENLKTLSSVCNLRFEQHVVEQIASVRKLVVLFDLNDDEDETWSDYHLHNLHHLSHLETLRVFLDFGRYDSEWCMLNPILESIVFPCSLKSLTIVGSAARIPWENLSSIIGPLPNLEEITLAYYVCDGDVWETKEGDFQKLRLLRISDSDLKCWRTESSSHFPILEKLYLGSCKNLTELPDCIGDIPTLKVIHLDRNHEAVSEWASQIEEEQREVGNDQLLIITQNHYVQEILTEVIEPMEEQLSVDQLAERLTLWAGDDENKLRQAIDVGTVNILSQSEASPNSTFEMNAFLDAMHNMIKRNEDGGK